SSAAPSSTLLGLRRSHTVGHSSTCAATSSAWSGTADTPGYPPDNSSTADTRATLCQISRLKSYRFDKSTLYNELGCLFCFFVFKHKCYSLSKFILWCLDSER